MAESSGKTVSPHLSNGLLVSRRSDAPSANVYIENAIRLIILNQATFFAAQQAKEEAVLLAIYGRTISVPLPTIPESQFSNSDAIDYNQQALQVAAVVETDPVTRGARFDRVRLGIGFTVKSKTGRPDLSSRQANAYLEAIQSIFETIQKARPQELFFGFTPAPTIESIQVRKVTNAAPDDELSREMSKSPYLEIILEVYTQTTF